MYIRVQLLRGYQKPLFYQVPLEWSSRQLIGTIVRVPIRTQAAPALVLATYQTNPLPDHIAIKHILQHESIPDDIHFMNFIKKIAQYHCIEPIVLIKRMFAFFHTSKHDSAPLSILASSEISPGCTQLTAEQQQICDALAPSIEKGEYVAALLHGVTGSGKTEVYKRLIEYTIAQQKSVILMFPEVTLARQFDEILRHQMPDVLMCSFHSGTKKSEKKLLWNYLLSRQPLVIIGVHLPVLVPITNLGLLIIDEEHDIGYQEKKYPKINSKEAAIMRAHEYKIPVLLGSATPSVSSLYNVRHKGWQFFQLTQRFSGAFPAIQIVPLILDTKRPHFWISNPLYRALQLCMAQGNQAIIFLNRRGFSFFVRCKSCSFVPRCKNCSVSLTLHDTQILQCHYCGWHTAIPIRCSSCSSSPATFLKKGIGTQQLVSILQELLPEVSIARLDMDITSKQKECMQVLQDFRSGVIKILVGTQSVTKGFHFPNVTLVGVLWADLALNLPVYHAQEMALQQLIQVAGRAGRATVSSHVIVQTMTSSDLFEYVDETRYISFYEREIEQRQSVGYPPFVRLAQIEMQHFDESELIAEAAFIEHFLRSVNDYMNYRVTILGPARPLVHMIKKNHMRTFLLKGGTYSVLQELFMYVDISLFKSRIFFVPNPY